MEKIDFSTLHSLPAADTEVLARLVERERAREAMAQAQKSGVKESAHFDIDQGILRALRNYCTAEGIEPGELIENLLLDRTRSATASGLETAFQQLACKTLVI